MFCIRFHRRAVHYGYVDDRQRKQKEALIFETKNENREKWWRVYLLHLPELMKILTTNAALLAIMLMDTDY
jgi:hypothetical protein